MGAVSRRGFLGLSFGSALWATHTTGSALWSDVDNGSNLRTTVTLDSQTFHGLTTDQQTDVAAWLKQFKLELGQVNLIRWERTDSYEKAEISGWSSRPGVPFTLIASDEQAICPIF